MSASPNPPAMRSPARLSLDPQALMAIHHLELRARVVVEGFWSGLHRSPYHGFSVEFTEYRQYTPGDDPRHLDWRLYARSDRFYLKKFEDETNLRGYLLVDDSRSMRYGSLGYTKADYARTLAATLAYFVHGQGDAVGLVLFDDHLREFLPPRHRAGHLRHLIHLLESSPGGARTDLKVPLRRMAEMLRRRSLVVLVSDLLAPEESFRRELTALASTGHELIVLQVLDPAEIDFPFQQASRFEDIESGQALLLDPQRARSSYLERFQAHCQSVRGLCERIGATHRQVNIREPLESVLFDFLRERMSRRRRTRVRRSGAAS